MSQSSYDIDMTVAFEGMLSDTTMLKDVLSLNNMAALVFVGKFVAKGVGEDEIIAPAAAVDITDVKKARGVVLHSHALESKNDGLDANYSIKSSVSVLHKGRMWVKYEDAPNPLVQPSVRFAGVGKAGAFVNTPIAAETALLPNAKVLYTAPGNLALIEIDL